MSDELRRLKQAAGELLATDRMLIGEFLPAGRPLAAARPSAPAPPAPAPAAPAAGETGSRFDVPPAPATDLSHPKNRELREMDVQQVRTCRKCRLCEGRRNTAFGEGNPDAAVFFIGEGPGEEEDIQGRPFVGRAGELLTKMIAAMGLRRSGVYIGNVVKCRPPGNRAPLPDEAAACGGYLWQQLRIIRPRVIVTLGNPATHAVLQTTEGITTIRGAWRKLPLSLADLGDVPVMPTFHPAYVLRSYTPDNRKKVWHDLQQVMKRIAAGES